MKYTLSTSSEVLSIMNDAGIPRNKIIILDGKYKLYTERAISKFLNRKGIERYNYIPEIHDCDDFALKLMVRARDYYDHNCFGFCIVRGGHHAMNIYINDKKQVKFIEPQKSERTEETCIQWVLI